VLTRPQHLRPTDSLGSILISENLLVPNEIVIRMFEQVICAWLAYRFLEPAAVVEIVNPIKELVGVNELGILYWRRRISNVGAHTLR